MITPIRAIGIAPVIAKAINALNKRQNAGARFLADPAERHLKMGLKPVKNDR